MPSPSIDFFYSFLAMMLVGTILTFSFASYAGLLREASEVNQLKETLKIVAAKAAEALSTVTEDNASVSIVIQLPLTIGNNYYWIRFANDSSTVWLEGAFGNTPISGEQEYRVYLPKKMMASGSFEGAYEFAQLNCSLNGSTPQIVLSRAG
jgi:hypothetical protein